ncbi:hypothetical protein KP509_37G052500 [Ceratopteris richardii]|uniref:CCHC-type domain-containing protein n=1 Tax=Ceratopteris richardii TaxID=49495 RepID=A0A8T2Q8N4_CERRI|nr:hypothetical protein KP509_37G052500 [Ceratopteris richardii]
MESSLSHGDTMPLPNDSQEVEVVPQSPQQSELDVNKLKEVMEEALTMDENVEGEVNVDIEPSLIWDSTRMFHERGLLLFYTARIPLAVDVAHGINESVERDVLDKVFYSGHGLFEVILKDRDIKLQILEQQTIFLCGLMAHVFPWKPVKAMKEELLFKCPVWVELIDLPSSLWSSIGQVAKVLGKLLYTPISAPNKNRICVMWNTSRPFPKTLGINLPRVGRIVIYLKWGNMAGSCFHCGNLGHYSKNCPTLKSEGVNFIPACPCSKILVPEEQVFGRPRNIPNVLNTCNNDALRSTVSHGIGNKGKEIAVEKHVLPATSIVPVKLNVYKRREGEIVAKDLPRRNGEEARKRVVDNDGFTPVSYKKALLRGKRSKFQSSYSTAPSDEANVTPSADDCMIDYYEDMDIVLQDLAPALAQLDSFHNAPSTSWS